jgi:DNA modification methylase
MDILRDSEVNFTVTSPPYFSQSTEKELSKPILGQIQISKVRKEIRDFAQSLAPNYKEMGGVLKEGGYLARQTMDIYYVFKALVLKPLSYPIPSLILKKN